MTVTLGPKARKELEEEPLDADMQLLVARVRAARLAGA